MGISALGFGWVTGILVEKIILDQADSTNQYLHNSRLTPYARKMRHKSTKAEIRIWCELLRASKLRGYPFRRQKPIMNYIADFVCTNLMLVIEVDGGYHNDPKVQAYDQKRQKALENVGFTVLRFTNEEVMERIEHVQGKLETWIDEFESIHGKSKLPKPRRRRRTPPAP